MLSYTELLANAIAEGDRVGMTLTDDWLQGRTAFGGWQAGLAVKAMRRIVGNDIPLRSLQVNFIAPVAPGPVTARAELLRQGKSATQVEARILIEGKVAFVALGIFAVERTSSVVERPLAAAPAHACETLTDLPFLPGRMPVFLKNFRQRWSAGEPPFSGAAHAAMQNYIRFVGTDVLDDCHLVCLADVVPPSALSMLRAPAPISSMNWTLELVAPLTEAERRGWFRFDSELTAAENGYGWENTRIWSDQGRLIALSRQCVAVFA